MECGLHCVTMTGLHKMSLLSAESWDTHQLVISNKLRILNTLHFWHQLLPTIFAGNNISFTTGTAVIKGISVIPECTGAETNLQECLRKPQNDQDCYPVLVNCSPSPSLKEMKVDKPHDRPEDQTGSEKTSDPQDKPPGDDYGSSDDDEEGNVGIGFGALLGVVVVTLAMMILLVLASGNLIFCLWYQRKRKRKIIRQIGSNSQQHSLHISPNHL